MACYTSISSVANTIQKFQILYHLHYIYQQNLYHDKQEVVDKLFYEYHPPLLKYIGHTELIQEWKKY